MNRIKFTAAFLALAAFAHANFPESSEQFVQLPPVVVEATRLPAPVIEVRPDLNEVRAAAALATQADVRHTLARSFRRLVAEQRRRPSSGAIPTRKPNV